jgi:hypothetical protein
METLLKSLLVVASVMTLAACGDDPGTLKPGAGYRNSGIGHSGSGSSGSGSDSNGSSSSGADQSGGATDNGGATNNGGAPSSGSSGTSGGSNGSSNGSNNGAPPASSGPATAEQTCVDTINMYRKSVGSPALTRWTAEESCANGQAQSDSSTNAAHGAFGMCNEYAQNECPGWPGAPDQMITGCLKAMWGEGPGGGHYENMKNAQFTQVSCGFYTLADGSVWAVQNFR